MKDAIDYIKKHLSMDDLYRYLSAKQEVPEFWENKVLSTLDEVIDLVELKYTANHYDMQVSPSENKIDVDRGRLTLYSESLSKHLSRSNTIWLVGATLGYKLERVIEKSFITTPTDAVIMDACGSVIVEAYCDWIETQIVTEEDHKIAPRFSPGYGDLDLSCQRAIADLLSLEKRTGIHLNKHFLMTPQKSVIFIIGNNMAMDNMVCNHKCTLCTFKQCAYRKGE